MGSLNIVHLIGNLGAAPEVRYLPSGDAVANLNLATTERWKDKEGEQQERTEWHRVTLFGRIAEVAEKYTDKGSLVYVSGSLTTRKWEDKDGNDRYTTEVRGTTLQLLDKAPKGERREERREEQRGGQDEDRTSRRESEPDPKGGRSPAKRSNDEEQRRARPSRRK